MPTKRLATTKVPKKTAKKTANLPRRDRPATKGATFDVALALVKHLPGIVESTSYGTRSIKAAKAMVARLKEDGKTLVVRMDIVSRDYVLQAEPDIFYLTDHYREYPAVLVRLAEIDRDRLREILEDAWRLVAPRTLVAAWDANHPE